MHVCAPKARCLPLAGTRDGTDGGLLTAWLSSSFLSAGLSVWEAAFLLTQGGRRCKSAPEGSQADPDASARHSLVLRGTCGGDLTPLWCEGGKCSSGHDDAGGSIWAFCARPMTLGTKRVWAGRTGPGGHSYICLQHLRTGRSWFAPCPGSLGARVWPCGNYAPRTLKEGQAPGDQERHPPVTGQRWGSIRSSG